MTDRWKSLEDLGFPGYQISDKGVVKSDKSNKYLKVSSNQYGLVRVGLMRPDTGRQITLGLSRLVANAFVKGKSPQFNTPINLNGNRNDNRASNLAWRPRWFAVKFFHQFDSDKEPLMTTRIYDVETSKEYEDSRQAAAENGLLEADIMKSVVNGAPCFPTWQIFARVSH